MDRALMNILTAQGMLACGGMINRKVKVVKHGKMDLNTKVNSCKAKNMDKVIIVSLIYIKGKYNWCDGSIYTGDWFENKISGYGVY